METRKKPATKLSDTFLPPSYLQIQKLTTMEGDPVETILEKVIHRLQGVREQATIHLQLNPAEGADTASHSYAIQLTAEGASLHTDLTSKPALVVITTSEIFHHMARGIYSPVQAYVEKKLTAQGDIELAKRVVAHLAAGPIVPDGPTTQSPILLGNSYTPSTKSLSFVGCYFTPNGQVVLHFDAGSFYESITTADSNGSFSFTLSGISCGDIPGHPGVGVIVYAYDVGSQTATVNYGWPTPCA
jgi:hypothetical protein